jgi:hypothetical protein
MDLGNASEKKEKFEEYDFSIRGFINLRIVNDSMRNDSIDRELSEKLSDEASKEVSALLIQRVNTIKDVYVNVETFKDTYDKNTVWNKDLKLADPVSMHIVIDSTSASKEDIYDAAIKIQDTLNQSGYAYGTININGNIMTNSTQIKDKMGYVKYSLAFKRDTKLKISDVKEMKK